MTTVQETIMTKPALSQPDADVVQLLLEHDECSVVQLEEYLHVTATAVRQRLTRLMAAGLVDRTTESGGRGRPVHQYRLTGSGRKAVGNNLADFAGALWQQIQNIPDDTVRQTIIAGAAESLAETYCASIDGQSIEDRIRSVASFFNDREIPVSVEENNGGLPTLKILACPYPDLVNDNHELCEMERQLFSKVTGGSFELCQCRQDGDQCCKFQASASSTKWIKFRSKSE